MKSEDRVHPAYRKGTPDWQAQYEMLLDDDVTCKDCAHLDVCCAMFGQTPYINDGRCQWHPNKFQPNKLPVTDRSDENENKPKFAIETAIEWLDRLVPNCEFCAHSDECEGMSVDRSCPGYMGVRNTILDALREKAERKANPKGVSDGYHTFRDLYHHRAVLFSVICAAHRDNAWKSKLHSDGRMFDDDMFIVGVNTPEGPASYHYHITPYWNMFDVPELDRAPEWDGYTPDESIRRIGSLSAASKNPEPIKQAIAALLEKAKGCSGDTGRDEAHCEDICGYRDVRGDDMRFCREWMVHDLIEAVEQLLKMIPSKNEAPEPLTLEQLREMDGEPVYGTHCNKPSKASWFLAWNGTLLGKSGYRYYVNDMTCGGWRFYTHIPSEKELTNDDPMECS